MRVLGRRRRHGHGPGVLRRWVWAHRPLTPVKHKMWWPNCLFDTDSRVVTARLQSPPPGASGASRQPECRANEGMRHAVCGKPRYCATFETRAPRDAVFESKSRREARHPGVLSGEVGACRGRRRKIRGYIPHYMRGPRWPRNVFGGADQPAGSDRRIAGKASGDHAHSRPMRVQSKCGPGSVLRPGAMCSWPRTAMIG